jgi:hypothetical protein
LQQIERVGLCAFHEQRGAGGNLHSLQDANQPRCVDVIECTKEGDPTEQGLELLGRRSVLNLHAM